MTQLGTYTKEGKPARVAETPADAVRFTFEGYQLAEGSAPTEAPEADVTDSEGEGAPAPSFDGSDFGDDLSDEDLEALTNPNA